MANHKQNSQGIVVKGNIAKQYVLRQQKHAVKLLRNCYLMKLIFIALTISTLAFMFELIFHCFKQKDLNLSKMDTTGLLLHPQFDDFLDNMNIKYNKRLLIEQKNPKSKAGITQKTQKPIETPATPPKSKNVLLYQLLQAQLKRRDTQKVEVKKIQNFKRMVFPSEKYINVPTTKIQFNGTQIQMHHQVLAPIQPEKGKNWFRRVTSHRYSFALNKNISIIETPEIQNYEFLKNRTQAIQFLWNRMLFSTEPTQFSKQMYFNWFNSKYNEAEYAYFDTLYNISDYQNQLPFCIVGTGRNLNSRNLFYDFFRTVSQLNYTNYKVIAVDDNSTDNSMQAYAYYIYKYFPKLIGRTSFITNEMSIGAFNNKDSAIKQNCEINDIVVDFDLDDMLVGKQVLKTMNAIYQQKPQILIAYSNYLVWNKNTQVFWKSSNEQLSQQQFKKYRPTLGYWRTSHLKTYKKKVYDLVPLSYLADLEHIREEDGKIYPIYGRYTSDQYMMISMVEIAGLDKTRFVDEILHLYRKSEQIQASSQCHLRMQEYGELKNRIKTPLQSITRMEDNIAIRPQQNYQTPEELMAAFKDKQNQVKTECRVNFFNPFLDEKQMVYKKLAELKQEQKLQNSQTLQQDQQNLQQILGFKLSDVSVVFISTTQRQTLNISLSSFFSMNSYPLDKIMVVIDGNETEYVSELKKKYQKNVTWLITNSTVGQVAAYDLAFQNVKSEYVLVVEDNSQFVRKRFIEYCLQIMQNQTNVSQVLLKNYDGVYSQNISLLDDVRNGFTYKTSMHKLSIYKMIQTGFTGFTRNVSYSKDGLLAQKMISQYYSQNGFRIEAANTNFIKYIQSQDEQPIQWPKFTYDIYDIRKKVTQMDEKLKNTCWYVSRATKADRKRYRLLQNARDVLKIQFNKSWLEKQRKIQAEVVEMMINESIQIGSRLHSNKLADETMSNNFTDNFTKAFYLDVINLQKIKKKPIQYKNIQYKNFHNYKEVENYLKQLQKPSSKQVINLKEVNLGKQLIKNEKSQQILEAEYQYYNKKYSLDEIITEQPLCIFIEGYEMLSRSNYTRMLNSIQSQNYSNYHIVIVDDTSPSSQSTVKLVAQLKTKHPKIYNKVSHFAKNELRLYTGGNLRIRANQLCKESDIVVNIGSNSHLVGRQAFKVINALYQNNQAWLVFFRAFQKDKNDKLIQPKQFPVKLNQNYRTVTTNNIQVTLKTFRNQILRLIPIEHLTQFSYNEQINMYTPHFYKIQSDLGVIYSLLEITGLLRLKIQQDILYMHEPMAIQENCKIEEQMYSLRKIQVKSPVRALGNFKSKAKMNDLYIIPNGKLVELKKAKDALLKCKSDIQAQQKKQELKQIITEKFSNFLETSKKKLVFPNHFVDYYKAKPYDSLPFCVAIDKANKTNGKIADILQSISIQYYSNIRIIIYSENDDSLLQQSQLNKFNQKVQIKYVNMLNQSYYEHLQILKNQCVKNSLVIYVNQPMKNGAFAYLNELHQKFNTWITYSEISGAYQIHSFYLRIFELIKLNDFSNSNRVYLEKGDTQLQTLILLQLCPKYSYKIHLQTLYLQGSNKAEQRLISLAKTCHLSANLSNTANYTRRPYDLLLKMSQDFRQNVTKSEQNLNMLLQEQGYFFKPLVKSEMNKAKLIKTVQYQQILFLPKEHSLNKREYIEFHEEYGIGNYTEQVPICLAVFGRNNTENFRHFKNVQSILQQNYTNYHIVYVDDDSNDRTLEEVQQMFATAKFPQDRIVYVKNKRRKFATYTIINTAFTFCGLDEVQIILDGDDELVGRQVFTLMNAGYQKHPEAWVVYTNFKSSDYGYGVGFHRPNENEYIGCDGRVNAHYLTPLRTWKVKFIRSIPLVHHQLQYGGWYDTLYDEGLQYVMLELAGPSRFFYIPVINYEYNRSYGSNDDSSKEKLLHRFAVLSYVHSFKMEKPLNSLDQQSKNEEIQNLLKADFGKEFIIFNQVSSQ